MVQDIEIIGITTCGTYPCWVDHTIASFYNHVDKVVVVNAGYDINHPEKGAIIPLEREHKLIQMLDIHNKIIEIIPTQEQIDHVFNKTCKLGKDEIGRSTSMTLATQIAHNLPNDKYKRRYILKADSDQIFYQFTRKQLVDIIYSYPSATGFRFAQHADYYHDFEHIGSLPDEFTNDGALFYLSIENQGYCGQGSPGYIKVDQKPIYTIRTAHMRRISPEDLDPYEYHFKRLWYHTYGPNSIGELEYNRETGKRLTEEQIREIAHNAAISILQERGKHINDFKFDVRVPYEPPMVCQMSTLEYIDKNL